MEWNQLIASCRSCVFEATGDSEADHRDLHGGDDRYADHDHELEDDDAQSFSCDSWGYNLGSGGAMEVDDVVEEGEAEEHQLEYYPEWPPSSRHCEMGGLLGGLRKEKEEEEEEEGEEEGDVVVSNEPGFGSNGLIKITKEMDDRLFWERCLATGY